MNIVLGSEEVALETLKRRDVERWINLEFLDDVVEACVNGSMEVLDSTIVSESVVEHSASEEEDAESTVTAMKDIPNNALLAHMFGGMEVLAIECQVGDALWHLQRARRAFLDGKHSRESTKQRQALITESLQTRLTSAPINAGFQ
ncbi:hypothetical protein BWQ96_06084 [Gracilariopsis chorda]|uniref:Uncharacterized protein n=1 Tax=Gracilariopsis chorda TaxID=448386 RepID=A0A2V3IQ22_9FLOR|nr:hypothetical protein BWQ96_06084 [Gracilariopsis chorda]|eukprot:PXF44157.1 hypothetical protein BWQ96_06084 [Gracilariopsis chorda]